MLGYLSEAAATFNPSVAVCVFVLYMFVDAMWAKYTLATAEKRPLAAANYSAFIYLAGALGVTAYVANILYILPALAGGWIGSYYGTR